MPTAKHSMHGMRVATGRMRMIGGVWFGLRVSCGVFGRGFGRDGDQSLERIQLLVVYFSAFRVGRGGGVEQMAIANRLIGLETIGF